jgi:two-component system, sensor histidine kinase and response regulator
MTPEFPLEDQRDDAVDEKVGLLLVDDEPVKLIAHEALLAELGQTIVKASSGLEALQALLQHDFAVILLDVNMPDMDGFELAELIRQRPKFENTPIIFITGYSHSEIDRLKGYSLGAVDFIFLPVVPEILRAKVGVFVKLAQQTQLIKKQAERLAGQARERTLELELIQKLNQQLLETNSELEAFNYSVSHDLKAPLRSIRGYTEVLVEDYGPKMDETARGYLGKIERAVGRMENLTRDLLAYSRIMRESIKLESVSLGEVIKEAMALNAALQAPPAAITVQRELSPVLAEPRLLTQCLCNLLDNALKFVPSDKQPSVLLRTERADDKVRIWVEDNGIGIDPAHHQKIFGLFERVGEVRAHEGTGVGLAIVARAVERMGGCCGVESAPGSGSRFWIELKAA